MKTLLSSSIIVGLFATAAGAEDADLQETADPGTPPIILLEDEKSYVAGHSDDGYEIDANARPEETADVSREGTGLTSQSGAGNETVRTIDEELSDAREPIAGDLDIDRRILEQNEEAED